MTERQLQAAVIELCKLYGIACYHTYDSRRSQPGWPDLAMCGTRRFITRELKTEYGEVTSEQDMWGFMLRNVGISWDVWRPDDLRSGRIQQELMNIRLLRRRDNLSAVVPRGRRIPQPPQSTSDIAISKGPMGDCRLVVERPPHRWGRARPRARVIRRLPRASGRASRCGPVEKDPIRLPVPRVARQRQPDEARGSSHA